MSATDLAIRYSQIKIREICPGSPIYHSLQLQASDVPQANITFTDDSVVSFHFSQK
jgi:hypothetical protein